MNLTFTLLTVASIWSIAVVTPGPNFFITAQTAVKDSRAAGLFVVLGTCTGTVVWSMAGYFGIASLFLAAPWLYTTLKVLGGSYIIFLGVTVLVGLIKSGTVPGIPQETSKSNADHWRRGLMTNLSNAKTAMFITSLFASALPKEPTILIGLLITALMVGISLVWYSFVVFVFSSPQFSSGYRRVQKWTEGIAGIIFIAFGAKLIFDTK